MPAPPPAFSVSRQPTARRASTARSRSSRRPSMSQLDLIAQIREHRPVAPAELRERVRQLAADAPAPRRRFTWRRALVVAIAVAGLAAVAGVLGTRDTGTRSSTAQPQGVEHALTPTLAPPRPKATRSIAPAYGLAATDSAAAAGS